jgi:hypothetical protein
VDLAFKSWGEMKAFVAGTNIVNAWKVKVCLSWPCWYKLNRIAFTYNKEDNGVALI